IGDGGAAGGLAGWSSDFATNAGATTTSVASVTQSYATGSVSGAHVASNDAFWSGGLFGVNDSTLSEAYSTGAVAGTAASENFVGGAIGGEHVFGTYGTSAPANVYWN